MSDAVIVEAGLCSVILRDADAREVASLAAECGLRSVEWGGDVHVPPGDDRAARRVRRLSDDLGLRVASYGSYLAAGRLDPGQVPVALDTAVALGAPHVRVWAHDDAAADLAAICDAAATRGLTVSVEYHPGTATETTPATIALLDRVAAPNLFSYWQPDPALDDEAALASLLPLLPRLSGIHVFRWRADRQRLPLAAGAEVWPRVLRLASAPPSPVASRTTYLEFVRDDDPAQLRADAATLHGWIASCGAPVRGPVP